MASPLRKIDAPSPVVRFDLDDDAEPVFPDDYLPVNEAILAAVDKHMTHEKAARMAGISPAALSSWIKQGVDHINWMFENGVDEPDEDYALYVDLALDITQREAAAEYRALDAIDRQMRRDWRAGVYILGHRYGGPWADQRTAGGEVTVSTGRGGATISVLPIPSHDEIEGLGAELKRRQLEAAAIDVKEA